MTQVHQVAILIPLAVAASAFACTIIIRALAVIATVNFIRRERRLGRIGAGFLIDLSIVALAISVALVAHLVEIAIWAVLFLGFSRRQDPADPLSLGDVKPGKALFGKVLLFRRLKLGGLIKRTDMKMRFRRPWESFTSQS